MTVAATYAPPVTSRAAWWIYQLSVTLAGSVLMALTARLSFDLPFSPVPITGQTFGVLVIGALLGSTRGALAVLAYLTEGACGLPVFAGGAGGLPYLLGPTAGYLIGFVPAAFTVGWFAERGFDRKPLLTALAMITGTAVILACGVSWLSLYVGLERAPLLGLYPFLIGDVVKIAAAMLALPSLRRFV